MHLLLLGWGGEFLLRKPNRFLMRLDCYSNLSFSGGKSLIQ